MYRTDFAKLVAGILPTKREAVNFVGQSMWAMRQLTNAGTIATI
jgi:hypothetical protein